MNKKETKKIATQLKKLGFEITNVKSNILWFGRKKYNGPLECRDKYKNLCKLNPYYSVWFDAEINKNGVGDGKKPDKALTYSIGFENDGSIREYCCQYFNPAQHFKFYDYSRNLKTLIKKFVAHLKSLNN